MVQVGPYRVLNLLGRGGYASTYLAEDEFGAQVAVKVLENGPGSDPESIARFQRELDLGRALNSKYIARVLDFDLKAKPPWIAFTYIPGRDLTSLIHEAPLARPRVLEIAQQLAAALVDLHTARLVHRDLKPDNVRVGARDSITIIDLGIAWIPGQDKITQFGVTPGTVTYLAPESLEPGEPTSAWDIWAFGLILAQVSGGAHPFGGWFGNTGQILTAIRFAEPDISGVPYVWRRAVAACLDRTPGNRPDAMELQGWLSTLRREADMHGKEYTGTAYCVKCKEKREFTGEVSLSAKGSRMAKGKCPVCGTTVTRFLPLKAKD